jgi:hypothetical protein
MDLGGISLTEINPYPQLTADSEKCLIQPLLENNIFKSRTINRYFASYPSAKEGEKADVICKIMEDIWKEEKLFKTFKSFDFFLATSGKRGHFVHQFEVYLLGLNFILYFHGKDNLFHLKYGLESLDQVIFAWLITASAHDFGYSVEGAHKIFTKLSKLYKNFGLEYLSDKLNVGEFKEIIKKEGDFSKIYIRKESSTLTGSFLDIKSLVLKSIKNSLSLSLNEAVKLESTFIKDNRHGYVSALLLSRILLADLIGKNELNHVIKSWKYKSLGLAAGAIAIHNLDSNSETETSLIPKIKYEKNPLAYLLFIVDNIQDWSRTLFRDENFPEYKLEKYSLSNNDMRLEYAVIHTDWNDEAKQSVDDFLKAKSLILKKLKKPTNPFGLNISLHFHGNNNNIYQPITFNI